MIGIASTQPPAPIDDGQKENPVRWMGQGLSADGSWGIQGA